MFISICGLDPGFVDHIGDVLIAVPVVEVFSGRFIWLDDIGVDRHDSGDRL